MERGTMVQLPGRGERRRWRFLRALLIVLALVAPGLLPGPARAAPPALILAPERGQYRGDCAGPESGTAMAIGRDFPEGAGIAIYALRAEGLPLAKGNIATLLGTVVVREGRFVNGYLGLRTLLCYQRAAYPDGTRIEIVAADTARFDGDVPRDDAALARAIFTVDGSAPLPASQRCFAETLLCTRDRFHDYWAATGGLARHGYPLTGERRETLEDGAEHTVQYFERSRLELHPEHSPPYDVLLGQFGRRILATVGDAPTAPVAPLPGQVYFEATGHNVAPDFAAYWTANGGLAGFGLPLTEEFDEFIQTGAPGEGRVFRVQYFERARFERHPENAPPYDILLGQFGRRILEEQRHPPTPPGVRAIVPTRPGAPPGEPTYTEADVRAYLERNGLPLGRIRSAGPYTIERVEFLTGAVAEQTHDVTLGPPPERLYCLVTVRGAFTITGPPRSDGSPNTHTFTQLILIFDGRTGNILSTHGRP
jgi:hypothetical protein